MIHEEICTYEVAKLAKEKGFPLQKVIKQDGRAFFCELPQSHPDWANCDAWYLPTQSLLQRWLREEKGIVVEVIAQPTCSTSKKNCYWWSIKQNSDGICYQYEECSYLLYSDEGYFDTYELALEDALKYALENLM
jgi:hypothetical protein